MSRIAYVRDAGTPGTYTTRHSAAVSVEDRGFLFADGIYEVCELRDGCLVDESRHLDRYEKSLAALRITPPMSRRSLQLVLREVVRRNRVRDGIVYFQITRGAARRDHGFPTPSVAPTLTVFVAPVDVAAREARATQGIAVVTVADERWFRRDIKSVNLLPNVLAKQAAREAGAYEAWLVDADGYVTEGSSTNAWIITPAGTLVTRPLSQDILPGITRSVILETATQLGINVEERKFSVGEALSAAEAFLSSSSAILLPVIRIDENVINKGQPGPVAVRLRAASRANSRISDMQLPYF